MERKDFLKSSLGVLGLSAVLMEACKKDVTSTDTTSGSDDSGSCSVATEETAGPYPEDLSSNSAMFRQDITEGKTGIPLNLTLTVVNTNSNCAAIENARVDIWHCDKDGYYSAYSNTGYLGAQNNIGKTFLRGIQLTDSNGEVTFTTIYPGWYSGRATHIHVEVFINSVLKATTQLAFPEELTTTVYNTSLYSAHGQNTTTNETDMVFSDSYAKELVTITGDTTNSYTATYTIGIAQ
ncbi:MAG TPA: intradiol ring-cleavage dioxygenase [Chitinophagaceae bacterium]|nr:intradiol ring-cleavage dioxygenase [Chitinophagaceae bacterium]